MATETTDTQQLVVFTLAGEHYALPITLVQEIIRWTEPRSVASRDPEVRGVISLRGKIIPVYDLALRLGHVRDDHAEANIAIVDAGAVTVGIVVDSVDEVLEVADDQLEPLPVGDTEAIEAIAKVGDRLIGILAIASLSGGHADLPLPVTA